MKTFKIITLLLAFMVTISLNAQDSNEMKTLFSKSNSDKKISHGGYGSFSIGYSQVDGKDAMQLGGRAAWIANHHFALGFAGYGFFNSIHKNTVTFDDFSEYSLAGGYGGLFFEPIIMPNSPVHVSFPILMGVGGVSAIQTQDWGNSSSSSSNRVNYYDTDAFVVLEPGVDIEFNIVKFFRVAIGASYRLTNGVNLRYKYVDQTFMEQTTIVDKNALNSFTFNVGFKFGWF